MMMQNLSPPNLAFILAVKLLGYYIFRGANGQKDAFRCGYVWICACEYHMTGTNMGRYVSDT